MPQDVSRPDPMAEIGHQLTRIADSLTQTGETQVSREQAHDAWEKTGMRIYEDMFLKALDNLNIRVV